MDPAAEISISYFGLLHLWFQLKHLGGKQTPDRKMCMRLNVAWNRAKNQQSLLVPVEEMKERGVEAYPAHYQAFRLKLTQMGEGEIDQTTHSHSRLSLENYEWGTAWVETETW